MDAQKFGAFIAQIRREQGLTQAELASKLHVTDKAVSRWERGLGFPDINTFEPLAAALGITMVELMQSQRASGGAVSREAASAAMADTLTLAQQQRSSVFFDLTVVLACLLCAGLTIWLAQFKMWAETLVFFAAVGVMLIGAQHYIRETSIHRRRNAGMAALVACIFLLFAGTTLLQSTPATQRFAAVFLVYFYPVLLAVWLMLLARRVRAFLGGEDLLIWGDWFSSGELAQLPARTRSVLTIAFTLLFTLQCLFGMADAAGSAAASLRDPPQAVVTRQYAALCLERDCGVTPAQITDTEFDLVPEAEWGGWDDLYAFTFTWQGADGPETRCYSVVLFSDFTCELFGRGGALADSVADAQRYWQHRQLEPAPGAAS